MASWSFNASGSDGRAALIPQNHPVGDPNTMPELATTGNALRADVQVPHAGRSMFSPPSAGWTSVRTSGAPTRLVVWAWRVAAIDRAKLLTVRYKIERYLDKVDPNSAANPRPPSAYTLSDGTRSALAVLLPAGTRSIAPAMLASDGQRWIEDWFLTFVVGRAQSSASAF